MDPLDLLDPLWNGPELKFHRSPWAPNLTLGPQWCLGDAGISVTSKSMSSKPPNLIISLNPMHTLVNSYMSLWERMEKRLRVYIWHCSSVFSSVGSDLSFKCFLVLNWLKSGNWLWCPDTLFWWFMVYFCSLDLDLAYLYRSSKN